MCPLESCHALSKYRDICPSGLRREGVHSNVTLLHHTRCNLGGGDGGGGGGREGGGGGRCGGRRFRIDELSYLVGVCRRYNYRSNNGGNATASYGRRDA